MRIDIVTIFPNAVMPYSEYGVLSRAREKKLACLNFVNLRDYTKDPHGKVDDYPFGGGPGMVFMVQPLADAIESLKTDNTWTILTSPQGSVFDMKKARELSVKEHLVIVCGRYRGVDQRFIDKYVNEEISIGDYILSGGELPSLVIAESVIRLLPGVLNNDESLELDSFSGAEGQLEEELYTRPSDYNGMKVPDVLLSGDHGKIKNWRKSRRIEKTDKKKKGK
ncbi:tRNA (guanosine(37)-N1)-methyltransferase TrmD [candidate division WOR-3 bacterium]|nr:tRNA (guanosine(37)-N1)-methyltransferase TrmD [candidate division WOR-3 bacterium]